MFLSFQMAPGGNFLAVFVPNHNNSLQITTNTSETMEMYQWGGHLLEMYQKMAVHYVPPPIGTLLKQG